MTTNNDTRTESSSWTQLTGGQLAAEADRLLAATRSFHGDFERHGGPAANLAAAQVYALLALVVAVNHVSASIERHVGGVQ